LTDPVDAHVAAYNARDVERFLGCYAPDCVVEDARGNVLLRGRDEMRAHFERVFRESPKLHCEIVHRARVGEYVVDEERITGRVGGDQHGVVVSHVAGGLIDHQRYIR
jgi:uncharacterized protein (TIGR02246 family)